MSVGAGRHRGLLSSEIEATEPGAQGRGDQSAVVVPVAMATCDLDRPLGLGATPFPLPLHLGHDCVAEVLSVGSAVHTVRPGDQVVVPFQISCGVCPACRQGQSGNGRTGPPLSMYGFGVAGGVWGGTLAEQVAVPYADAIAIPGLLELVANGSLRPELVTTTRATFDEAPAALRNYLLSDDLKPSSCDPDVPRPVSHVRAHPGFLLHT